MVTLLAISPNSSLDAIFGMYYSSQHCLKSRSPIFCTHPHDELSLCGAMLVSHQRFSVSRMDPPPTMMESPCESFLLAQYV